ncbi:MAG: nucleotidyltransferase family protein [Acidobacteriota bacterium]
MKEELAPAMRAGIDQLCKRHKIKELSLFGSRVRGDFTATSDFDFLVEFLPDANIGLYEYSGIQVELEDMLGQRVDLVTKKGLKPLIKDQILADAEIIYEA